MLRYWRGGALGLVLCFLPHWALAQQQVQATGHAYVAGPADRDAARLRALADALVQAALAGGAELLGYSAVAQGRMIADTTVMRPMGRVLSYQLIRADLADGQWRVDVSARVGPVDAAGACAGQRRLALVMRPARVKLAPNAPSWLAETAGAVAQSLDLALRQHPATSVMAVQAQGQKAPRAAGLDYLTLTRGSARNSPGDHQLAQDITIALTGAQISLRYDLAFTGPDGRVQRHVLQRFAPRPLGGVGGLLPGQGRAAVQAALMRGVDAELAEILAQMTCQPPQAVARLQGDKLVVPLGQQHGLRASDLGYATGFGKTLGLLRVAALSGDTAQLVPLDPNDRPAAFEGRVVAFLQLGLCADD